MKNHIKFLSLILVCLITVSLFSGCKRGDKNSASKPETTTTTTVSSGETVDIPKIEFEKFDGWDIELYDKIIDSQVKFIKDMQTDDGAIPKRKAIPFGEVVPYFSCFAALGLVEAGEIESAKKYMQWHFSHLNRDKDSKGVVGTIYDWVLNTEFDEQKPSNDYDSSDSYAALFLMLLESYYNKTKDAKYFEDKKDDIIMIYNAMLATEDGELTWAKPDYRVKYTMDNSEVYAGMISASNIFKVVYNDENKSKEILDKSKLLQNAFEEKLWFSKFNIYHVGLSGSTRIPADEENILYPDALCQIYPGTFGVIPPRGDRSKYLFSSFTKNNPSWTKVKTDDYPAVFMSYAATKTGDYKNAHTFLSGVATEYVDNDNPAPWYSMESGCAILAAIELKRAALADLG